MSIVGCKLVLTFNYSKDPTLYFCLPEVLKKYCRNCIILWTGITWTWSLADFLKNLLYLMLIFLCDYFCSLLYYIFNKIFLPIYIIINTCPTISICVLMHIFIHMIQSCDNLVFYYRNDKCALIITDSSKIPARGHDFSILNISRECHN